MHLLLNDSASARGLIFMTIIFLSIIIGYILPNSKQLSLNQKKLGLNTFWEKTSNVDKIIIISAIITIVNSVNIILSFYPNLSEITYYLKNPGQAYIYTKSIRRNPDILDESGGFGSIITIALTLLSATKYIFLIFSFLYWKQLKIRTKFFSIVTLIIYIISSFLTGAMITIGAVVLSLIPVAIVNIKRKKNVINLPRKLSKRPKRIKILFAALVGICVILFFISNRISQENDLFEGIKVLGFYISHGYIGLDYCLELPFETTYGFTSIRGISTMFVKYLGVPDLFQNSYLVRNEMINGYPALSVWSTIFPWLASDFSFYLLPIIMGYVSFQFSLLWNKTIRTGNPYGYLLLGQFFIFWFMIPANNQVFHTLGNAASFFLILFLYAKNKKFYIMQNKQEQQVT
ncbi:hypothetical protein FMIA91_17820 [Fidelibacter multiformis]